MWDLHCGGALVWVGLDHVTRPVSPPYAGVCLGYFTSGFNTAAVDHEADGSTNNGIFQISSRKWCRNLNPNVPNRCQMYCSGRRGLSLALAGARPLHQPSLLMLFFALFTFVFEWGSLHILLVLPRRVGRGKRRKRVLYESHSGSQRGDCPECYRNGGGLLLIGDESDRARPVLSKGSRDRQCWV